MNTRHLISAVAAMFSFRQRDTVSAASIQSAAIHADTAARSAALAHYVEPAQRGSKAKRRGTPGAFGGRSAFARATAW